MKPPPLVPSSLMISWDATGPSAIRLRRAFERRCIDVRIEIVGHAIQTSTSAKMSEIGISTHSVVRVRSTQKFPIVFALRRANPRITAAAIAIPAAAERKLCDVSPEHLGQVAQRLLARVGLPVGVGGEARCGVEGESGRYAGEVLRIERQVVLQALEGVQENHRDEAEREHRDRVSGPRHLDAGIYSAEFVDQSFDRREHPVEKSALIARRLAPCTSRAAR